jgi:hypothetical protein
MKEMGMKMRMRMGRLSFNMPLKSQTHKLSFLRIYRKKMKPYRIHKSID